VEARPSGKITHQYIKRDWLISAGVALLYARRMASTELTAATSGSGNRAGVYLAFLQLVFTLGWTTYVIYLPGLAKQVGIAPTTVILILMMDQAIFTITDTAMGIAADRIASTVGRLGMIVAALTAISCAAFVALPFVSAIPAPKAR
jgi:MFS family permease